MSDAERLRVAIAGAGGMGREALAWVRDARPDVDPVVFFTADASERPVGADLDLDVVDTIDAMLDAGVRAAVLGIGDPLRRGAVAEELDSAGIELLEVIHPSAVIGPGVSLAAGVLVTPGCVLTRDIRLECGVIVNYHASLGHDCTVGAFAFIGPGAVLTGDVHVGAGALIGAGAVIMPGRTVGANAQVGAGAVVTTDVGPGTTVAGSPARRLTKVPVPSD